MMKEKITPCLWYDNGAQEAANLYCSVFADTKIASQSPIVTELNVAGQSITLLDGGPMYQPNASISFYYCCKNEQELNSIWNAFAQEGTVVTPVGKQYWCDLYGWVIDKFGISWQLAVEQVTGQKITPYLLFTGEMYGQAEAAIAHYSSIFHNAEVKSLTRFGQEDGDAEGKVRHAELTIDGQVFMLMDSMFAPDLRFSEGVSLTIHCETQEEIDYYWSHLTQGGEESMCGWLKDKFGVSWQVIPNILGKLMSDPEKAGKAAQAFMSMRKFNIEQIVQASIG
jgi:predicted 3-demethylubiquinone-9 3-methyltransferase (glyoxalase superfamily)